MTVIQALNSCVCVQRAFNRAACDNEPNDVSIDSHSTLSFTPKQVETFDTKGGGTHSVVGLS